MNITPSLSESKVRMADSPALWTWNGSMDSVEFSEAGMLAVLQNVSQPVFILDVNGRIGLTNHGRGSTWVGRNCPLSGCFLAGKSGCFG